MQIIISILLIILSIATTIQSKEHKKYKDSINKYVAILKEGMEIQEKIITTTETQSDYYKKAYEDTILEYIELMKLINRRK